MLSQCPFILKRLTNDRLQNAFLPPLAVPEPPHPDTRGAAEGVEALHQGGDQDAAGRPLAMVGLVFPLHGQRRAASSQGEA